MKVMAEDQGSQRIKSTAEQRERIKNRRSRTEDRVVSLWHDLCAGTKRKKNRSLFQTFFARKRKYEMSNGCLSSFHCISLCGDCLCFFDFVLQLSVFLYIIISDCSIKPQITVSPLDSLSVCPQDYLSVDLGGHVIPFLLSF